MTTNTNSQFRLELLHEITDDDDDNIDAVVHFDNGESFGITFFTKRNISTLLEKWKETGENLNGAYFWSIDCIIVEKLEYSLLDQVVTDMLKYHTQVFERHFTRISKE
ncbi:MAG: hypothetical protein FWD31_14200 [Planctomycetaceae bacterium]|nr:hypothetical protein [Planctomycetaceae bacterium]